MAIFHDCDLPSLRQLHSLLRTRLLPLSLHLQMHVDSSSHLRAGH